MLNRLVLWTYYGFVLFYSKVFKVDIIQNQQNWSIFDWIYVVPFHLNWFISHKNMALFLGWSFFAIVLVYTARFDRVFCNTWLRGLKLDINQKPKFMKSIFSHGFYAYELIFFIFLTLLIIWDSVLEYFMESSTVQC